MAIRTCVTCGKSFVRSQAKGRSVPRYCSVACCCADKKHQVSKSEKTAATRWPKRVGRKFNCTGCNKIVEVADNKRDRERKWCSTACKYKHMQKNEVIEFDCVICGERKRSTVRIGRAVPRYCSRQCVAKCDERNASISKKLSQSWTEPEVRKRFTESTKLRCQKDEWKSQRREIMLRAYENGSFTETVNTKPVQKVKSILESIGIEYVQEWRWRWWSFDFYLPQLNICIEVNGDYWHGNPAVYEPHKLTKQQRDRQVRDAVKTKSVESTGIRVLVFWERDIKQRTEWCVSVLSDIIHSKSKV